MASRPTPPATRFAWLPAGGRAGADVTTFDFDGKRALPETFAVDPTRILVAALLPSDSVIDLSTGRGEVALLPPGGHRLGRLRNGALRGRRERTTGEKTGQRSQLNRHRNSGSLPRLHATARWGGRSADRPPRGSSLSDDHRFRSPLRGIDSARTVVRLEGGCSRELTALRFLVGNGAADVLESEERDGTADVVLRLGNVEASALTITAVRADDPSVTVAVAHTETRASPVVRATLELPGYPHTNFIPTNRRILVHVPKLEGGARLVVLPIDGVYSVHQEGANVSIQGDETASGLTALRFGYRVDSLRGISVSSTWRRWSIPSNEAFTKPICRPPSARRRWAQPAR